MIEVTVAIAAASKAITVIKKGLALGRDTQELSSQFAQFFDAKDKIDKAKACVIGPESLAVLCAFDVIVNVGVIYLAIIYILYYPFLK